MLTVGPALLFPACGPAENGMWMKCHWSGQAVVGTGAVLVLLSLAGVVQTNSLIRAGLSLAAISVGLFAAALPNGLIGPCGNAEMRCRAVMRPAVTILGVVIVLLNAAYIFLLLKQARNRGDI